MCACVLRFMCLIFFLLRDDFESLKCCLDPWLSCMFDCIHVCIFLFFEKLFLSSSTTSRQIAIYRDHWATFFNRSYRIFDPSKFSEICLNSFSIHQKSFCLSDRFSTASRSIKVFCCRQILDSTSTDSFVKN